MSTLHQTRRKLTSPSSLRLSTSTYLRKRRTSLDRFIAILNSPPKSLLGVLQLCNRLLQLSFSTSIMSVTSSRRDTSFSPFLFTS